MDDLKPIAPDEALTLYLDHRRREVAKSTLRSHKTRLGHFVRWCEHEFTSHHYIRLIINLALEKLGFNLAGESV